MKRLRITVDGIPYDVTVEEIDEPPATAVAAPVASRPAPPPPRPVRLLPHPRPVRRPKPPLRLRPAPLQARWPGRCCALTSRSGRLSPPGTPLSCLRR